MKIYDIPKDVVLRDTTWKELLKEVVKEFKTAHQHHFLCQFLRISGSKYQESQRSLQYVGDLLMLRVNKLLSGNDL